jgi:hypothetical protein
MKSVTKQAIVTLAACVALMAFVADAAAQDQTKAKNHPKTPIIALALDGTSWIAGEAKFRSVDGILEVSIDMACGVPNAGVYVSVFYEMSGKAWTEPTGYADDQGKVKCVQYDDPNMPESFTVYIRISVKGTNVLFFTSESDPAIVEPK